MTRECVAKVLDDHLFVCVDALRQRSTAEVMSGRSVNILSTLFLGKPPRGR